MQRKTRVFSMLFAQLTAKDKLALRQTSQSWRQIVSDHQDGPYLSRAHFVIGASHQLATTTHLTVAWSHYLNTVTSSSMLPACLYKYRDGESYPKICMELKIQGEIRSGRLYTTVSHSWATNQAWVLAQIHHRRSFIIYSDLSDDFLYRYSKPGKLSAFAKEIACVIKAGYSIGHARQSTDEPLLMLHPASDLITGELTTQDIDVSDEEVILAYRKVQQEKQKPKITTTFAIITKPYIPSITRFNEEKIKMKSYGYDKIISLISNKIKEQMCLIDNKDFYQRFSIFKPLKNNTEQEQVSLHNKKIPVKC